MYKEVFNKIIWILEDPVWSAPIKKIYVPQRAKFERYLQALSAVRPLIDDLRILGEYTAAL